MRQIYCEPTQAESKKKTTNPTLRWYETFRRQIRQEWFSYGLKRDLHAQHTTPQARIPIYIREFQERDAGALFRLAPPHSTRQERLEVANRLALLAEGVPACFVAVDEQHDTPCFVQWLMTYEHNDKIQRFFRGRFPLLAPDEALLENAYTPPQYRGLGIMSLAMALVAERAIDRGCRFVITFVQRDNSASLKGCARAGFAPFLIRRDTHFLFHLIRRRTFTPLSDGAVRIGE
jgi:hypothetical protein